MKNWFPLVEYKRNNLTECTIHGSVAWVSGGELIHLCGENITCYGRSLMKPIMMKSFVNDLDSVLNWQQKALSISSHNGEEEQINLIKTILPKSLYKLLKTPKSLPLIDQKKITEPNKWYNTCSGEHSAILLACKIKNWPLDNYQSKEHNVFESFIKKLKNYLNNEWTPKIIALDGCGLPTIAMSIKELAQIYENLVIEKDKDWIWEAMIKSPNLIGGLNRLDSNIISECNGKVIAKEGADGLLGLSIKHKLYPKGLGIVIKIAHGWDPQATWFIAKKILLYLGFKIKNPKKLNGQIEIVSDKIIPKNN